MNCDDCKEAVNLNELKSLTNESADNNWLSDHVVLLMHGTTVKLLLNTGSQINAGQTPRVLMSVL